MCEVCEWRSYGMLYGSIAGSIVKIFFIGCTFYKTLVANVSKYI